MTEAQQTDYADWFQSLHGFAAHPWQRRLAARAKCDNQLLRIPTGLGKTAGVLSAWAWHRVCRDDDAWPRRLVWTLPMRVLAEQTAEVARSVATRLADGAEPAFDVVVTMGGIDGGEWRLHPERPTVLVGTQDMLLSRALNRGYASPRARWPMEYALLHHDALWVLDEVQLMDVGLTTSVQCQALREQRAPQQLRPTASWWMSATLQPAWLETVESRQHLPQLQSVTQIPDRERSGPAFAAKKPVKRQAFDRDAPAELAQRIATAHLASEAGPHGRVTLVVLNTVRVAQATFEELLRYRDAGSPLESTEVRLVHSRFRGLERRTWREEFLCRERCNADADRIIVATQAIEAGVDISASLLISELAPWPSLVQRFGRAGRYGTDAEVLVIDAQLTGDMCLPYDEGELAAARAALADIDDVALATLERFEQSLREQDPARCQQLFPFDPMHVLTARDADDLFDTTPDLTGADIDISRFIRSGDERDIRMFWAEVPEDASPGREIQPSRDGLCAVPVGQARELLFKAGAPRHGKRAWVWDYLDGAWQRARADSCYPGQVFLVDGRTGGYDPDRGFIGLLKAKRLSDRSIDYDAGLTSTVADRHAGADLAQEFDHASFYPWKTIATHGFEVGAETQRLAEYLRLPKRLAELLHLAGRLHDWGKAHPAFQANINWENPERPQRHDLAKAPADAWHQKEFHCHDRAAGRRQGLRHELVSALAMFELLRRHAPTHGALLGPWIDILTQLGQIADVSRRQSADQADVVLADELSALEPHEFDLVAYLVLAHHGKVRGSLQSTPLDQGFDRPTMPVRGVCQGDGLPGIELVTASGDSVTVPDLELHLALASTGLSTRYGASWTDRVVGLLRRYGPYALAYLETLLRVADVRASIIDTEDPRLHERVEAMR